MRITFLVVSCVAAAVLLFSLWRVDWSTTGELDRAAPLRSASQLGPDDGNLVHGDSPSAPSRPARRMIEGQEVDVTVLAEPAEQDETESEIDKAFDRLRKEIEETLYERMDPGALLAVAQRIAELETELAVVPEPTRNGGVRFEFVDTPGQMSAALEVLQSNVPEYESVLALEVKCDARGESTYLDGAYRDSPTLRATVWTDSEGKPLHLVLNTSLDPQYRETLRAGFDLNSGTLSCGLGYHLDVTDPSKSGMKAFRMIDGLPTDMPVPMTLDGEEWPQMDKVQEFGSTMLALRHSLSK